MAYVRAHSPHFFPALTERPRLVRQAAPLWPLPAALPRRLVRRSRQAAAPVPVLDTLPLPLCSYTRGGRRDPCLAGHAEEGDGAAKADWFMVAWKNTDKPKWKLVSIADTIKFFSEGKVEITRAGNLKVGRITMQRKGGDGGRETAKMLQFKINPALLVTGP